MYLATFALGFVVAIVIYRKLLKAWAGLVSDDKQKAGTSVDTELRGELEDLRGALAVKEQLIERLEGWNTDCESKVADAEAALERCRETIAEQTASVAELEASLEDHRDQLRQVHGSLDASQTCHGGGTVDGLNDEIARWKGRVVELTEAFTRSDANAVVAGCVEEVKRLTATVSELKKDRKEDAHAVEEASTALAEALKENRALKRELEAGVSSFLNAVPKDCTPSDSETAELRVQLSEAKAEIDRLLSEQPCSSSQVAFLEQNLHQARARIADLESSQAVATHGQLRKARATAEHLEESLLHAEIRVQEVEKELVMLKTRPQESATELASMRLALAAARKKEEELEAHVEALMKELRRPNEGQLQELRAVRSRADAAEERQKELEELLFTAKQSVAVSKDREDDLEAQVTTLAEALSSLQDRVEVQKGNEQTGIVRERELRVACQKAQEEVSELKRALEGSNSDALLASMRRETESLSDEKTRLEYVLETRETRIESLMSKVASLTRDKLSDCDISAMTPAVHRQVTAPSPCRSVNILDVPSPPPPRSVRDTRPTTSQPQPLRRASGSDESSTSDPSNRDRASFINNVEDRVAALRAKLASSRRM
ncbi:hypothetical protein DIPPA_04845 [Diplonema papillatum]|nr:hypothetical protein DIPPA_04845 [Diplonema papillatum]